MLAWHPSLTSKQRAGLVPACLLFILWCGPSAQANSDTIVVIKDSIHSPLPTLGRLSVRPLQGTIDVSKERIRTIQYRGLQETLVRQTGALPRSLGGFGQHNALTFTGESPAAQSYALNGRSLFEPWSLQFHLEQASVEGYERIEILHGTDAVGLGANMSLHAINLQQIVYNTATPITRMWYAQGGGELLAGDVTFSQNVANNLNATIGIRRSGALGRYARTDFDVWNVRTALRWAPSMSTHILLTYDAASLNTDQWGGVRTERTADLDETTSLPIYAALRDESRRHDLQLTATRIFGLDTSTVVSASTYVTFVDMLRQRESSLSVNAADDGGWVTMHGRMLGAQVRVEQRIGDVTMRGGVSADHLQNSFTVYAPSDQGITAQGWMHVVLALTSVSDLRASLRILSNDGDLHTGGGVAASVELTDGLQARLDASSAVRVPSPAEGRSLDPERHYLLEASITAVNSLFSGRMSVFHRRITNAYITRTVTNAASIPVSTVTEQGNERAMTGLMGHGLIRIGDIEIAPTVRAFLATQEGAVDSTLPVVSGAVTVAYVFEPGANSVRLGATFGILSPIRGPGYSPLTWTMTTASVPQDWSTTGIDVHLNARVGNASIRMAWENLLGTPWLTVAGYPEISRNFRLSVSWSFFD